MNNSEKGQESWGEKQMGIVDSKETVKKVGESAWSNRVSNESCSKNRKEAKGRHNFCVLQDDWEFKCNILTRKSQILFIILTKYPHV